MHRRDFLFAGMGGAAAFLTATAAEPVARVNLGLLLYSFSIRSKLDKDQGFADPQRFIEFAHERGATAVQLPLGIRTLDEANQIQRNCDRLGMQLECIVMIPKEAATDLDRFSAELATARACGATIARIVMLSGRRYELFNKPSDFPDFMKAAEETLKRAERIAAERKVVLAVENHKDFRVDELIDLLQRISSDWVGVCIDTGNNLALLEDPHVTVEALAPFGRTVHLKDIAVEETSDGFCMSEVPLGRGCFDLNRMVTAIRKFNPKAIFQLEMITRDPLSIPCLTEKYWATLQRVPGSELAKVLAKVRASAGKGPLTRITKLSTEAQVSAENSNVVESFAFAARMATL